MSWDVSWRLQLRWLNEQIVGACLKGKGHKGEKPSCLCWSRPYRNWQIDSFIWYQWPGWEWCGKHGGKMNWLFNFSISVERKPIQQVDRMVYLGYMATEDGKCDKEIKRRIGIARTAFETMAKILTSRNISIELRSRIAKCYIWSTLLYGAETWTLTKVTFDKLEAFEMWLYRRMLRIS